MSATVGMVEKSIGAMERMVPQGVLVWHTGRWVELGAYPIKPGDIAFARMAGAAFPGVEGDSILVAETVRRIVRLCQARQDWRVFTEEDWSRSFPDFSNATLTELAEANYLVRFVILVPGSGWLTAFQITENLIDECYARFGKEL